MTRRPQFRTPGRYPDTILRSLAIDSAPAGRPHTMRSSALIPHRRVKTQGSLPTEDAALILLFSLVASGQIKLRKIDGTTMAAVTASRCGQRPDITELCYRAPDAPINRNTGRSPSDFPHQAGHHPAASAADFTQELPRKLLPTRAKEAQSRRREKR